jgi:hypothetical protein
VRNIPSVAFATPWASKRAKNHARVPAGLEAMATFLPLSLFLQPRRQRRRTVLFLSESKREKSNLYCVHGVPGFETGPKSRTGERRFGSYWHFPPILACFGHNSSSANALPRTEADRAICTATPDLRETDNTPKRRRSTQPPAPRRRTRGGTRPSHGTSACSNSHTVPPSTRGADASRERAPRGSTGDEFRSRAREGTRWPPWT